MRIEVLEHIPKLFDSLPLNLGSMIICQTENGESDVVSLSELGFKKRNWQHLLPISWDTHCCNVATMF